MRCGSTGVGAPHSRGNDFGPVANATAVQVKQAQAQWEIWLDLQIAIRQPADYQ
jgi:hypothetical protein